MMLEEAQFTEILVRQNGPNQPGVTNLPICFVLGVSGPCNKLRNNPRHVIDTLDSQLDLERAMNGDLNELYIAEGNQREFRRIILRLKITFLFYCKLNGGYLEGNTLIAFQRRDTHSPSLY